MQYIMTQDADNTITEKWNNLVVRVTAWLLLPFWSENAEDKKHAFNMGTIRNYVDWGNDGNDEDKKSYMSSINALARRYKDLCALPSSSKPKDPTVGQIWDGMMQNPNRLLALFTLREGSIKTYSDASKIGHRRIKALLKDEEGPIDVSEFINNFDASLVAYPAIKEESSMDEEA